MKIVVIQEEIIQTDITPKELTERWKRLEQLPGIDEVVIEVPAHYPNIEQLHTYIGDADAVFGLWIGPDNMNEAFLSQHPNLKYVATLGHGWEKFDAEMTRKRGISISNTIYGSQTIAEYAFALLMDVCHHIGTHDTRIKTIDWSVPENHNEFCKSVTRQIELYDKTIGVIGLGMTEAGKLEMLQGSASETIIVKIADLLSTYGVLPALLGGTILAGILASTMSTADSQLLVCSSSVSKDIYQNILNPEASDKKVLNVARLTTFGVAVLAFFIAWDPNSSIMDLVSDAWAGLGAAFGPIVVMSLFWRRTNLPGAVAGLVSGAATVLIWDYLPIVNGQTIGNATGIYSLLVGFVISLCFIVIVSMVTKAPDETILAQFDEYKKYEEKDM